VSGDDIFSGSGDDWKNRAMLTHGSTGRWAVYAMGYKTAADALVAEVVERNGYPDLLVFPILYLYRHYLELSIKSHIKDAQKLLNVPTLTKMNVHERRVAAAQGHDILALWRYSISLVQKIHPDVDQVLLDVATRIIEAFDEIDHGGDACRFPESLQDTPNLTQLSEVNLRALRDDMRKAEIVMTQIEGVIDYEFDRRELQGQF